MYVQINTSFVLIHANMILILTQHFSFQKNATGHFDPGFLAAIIPIRQRVCYDQEVVQFEGHTTGMRKKHIW